MIILESIQILFGPNVGKDDAKILANWVEFDDVTGEQLGYGEIEVWEQARDPAKAEEMFPGIGSGVEKWKDMNPQVQNAARLLFKQIEKVVEDAVRDGDITLSRLKTGNKPGWMNLLKNK